MKVQILCLAVVLSPVSQPTFAISQASEWLLKSYQDSILKLPPDIEARVQAYFDEIYRNIKLDSDPLKPPKIILVNTTDARAYVNQVIEDYVFFDARYLLEFPTTDRVAAVYAHELQHFSSDQKRRMGMQGGKFANEVEAETLGILDRIGKRGQINPATGERIPAAYNLEDIIEDYQTSGRYSSTHPNRSQVALALIDFFAIERSKRRFPKEATPPSQFKELRPAIETALRATKPFTVLESGVGDGARQEVRILAREILVRPIQELDKIVKRCEEIVLMQDTPNDRKAQLMRKELDHASEYFRLLDTSTEPMLSAARVHLDLKETHPSLFQLLNLYGVVARELGRSGELFVASAPEAHEELQRMAGEIDTYFAHLLLDPAKFTESKPARFPDMLMNRNPEGKLKPFIKALVETRLLSHREALENLATKDPVRVIPALIFAEEQNIGNAEMFAATLSRAVGSLSAERALAAVKEGSLTPHVLKYIDETDRLDQHRLSHEVRKGIVDGLDHDQYQNLCVSLARHDHELLRHQIKKFSESGNLRALFSYLPEMGYGFSDKEKDDLFSTAVLQAVERQKAMPFVRTEAAHSSILAAIDRIESNALVKSRLETFKVPDFLADERFMDVVLSLRNSDPKMGELEWASILLIYFENRWRAGGGEARQRFRDLLETEHQKGSVDGNPKFSGDFNPMDVATDYLRRQNISLNWMGSIGWEMLRPDALSKYPKLISACERAVLQNPLFYLNALFQDTNERASKLLMALNWNEILSQLSPVQFKTLFFADFKVKNSSNLRSLSVVINAVFDRFGSLIEQNSLSIDEQFLMLRILTSSFQGSVENSQKVLQLIEKHILKNPTEELVFKTIKAVSPEVFGSQKDYLDFVSKLLGTEIERKSKLFSDGSTRQSALPAMVAQVKSAVQQLDPHLQQLILNDLAEKTSARLAEKDLFSIDLKQHEEAVVASLEYINAVLEAYSKLTHSQQWSFLRWVLGKRTDLASGSIQLVQMALEKRKIYISADRISNYLRTRLSELSPVARGAFFQLAFETGGLLEKELDTDFTYRDVIEQQLFESFPEDSRATIKEIYDAALYAFPKVMRKLILAIAYSESGKHGSPEVALRLILTQLGPLIQKFGQTLAFDPNMPESFRLELQKTWDELPSPGWWAVQSLLHRQYGDIEKAGFKMIAIRNAGTTEIVVELEGPNGERRIASVQREALDIATEVDAEDLGRFVEYLTTKTAHPERYAFLKLLVDDSIHTMSFERNVNHKRQMTEKMRVAYQRAAERLGGRRAPDGKSASIEGWNIRNVEYTDHQTSDGKVLVTQNIAPGAPLKGLQKTHPEIYKELSDLILRIENTVQNDTRSPVDKDRMPGQYFVDLESRTITFLDAGQAREISKDIRNLRDEIIGACLIENTAAISKAMKRGFGVQISKADQAELKQVLKQTSEGLKPLQTLQWLNTHGYKVSDDQRESYQDLVHAIRAKMRLAHWAEDLRLPLIRNEWKRLATSSVAVVGPMINVCADVLGRLREAAGKMNELIPKPATPP